MGTDSGLTATEMRWVREYLTQETGMVMTHDSLVVMNILDEALKESILDVQLLSGNAELVSLLMRYTSKVSPNELTFADLVRQGLRDECIGFISSLFKVHVWSARTFLDIKWAGWGRRVSKKEEKVS